MEFVINHPFIWLVMTLGCLFLTVPNMKSLIDSHKFPWPRLVGVVLCGLGAGIGYIFLTISVIAYIARTGV